MHPTKTSLEHHYPSLPEVKSKRLGDIVFFSPDQWNPNRWARKQMFAYLLQSYANKVIYSVDHRSSGIKSPELHKISRNFYLYNQGVDGNPWHNDTKKTATKNMLQLFDKLKICPQFIISYQHSNYIMAKDVVNSMSSGCQIIYDLTDDWTNFPGFTQEQVNKRISQEEEAITGANIVFAVSKRLFEWGKSLNPNTYYLPNATDFATMKTTIESGPIDDDICNLGNPVLGYTGRITPWRIDWPLLEMIADMEEKPSLVMIGELHQDSLPLKEKLLSRKNVHFLGPREYYSLPTFYRGFDVCILPHSVDKQTESMDPIKLYDYLGSGKPIVSSAVGEARKFSNAIKIAENHSHFLSLLREQWNKSNHNPEPQMEMASRCSWPVRTQELVNNVQNFVGINKWTNLFRRKMFQIMRTRK